MRVIGIKTRLQLHVGALCTIFFLAVYAKMVCPFINGLPLFELGANLLIIGVVQIALLLYAHIF